MDRNVLTATILIALIMMVWLFWLAPQQAVPTDTAGVPADSAEVAVEPEEPEAVVSQSAPEAATPFGRDPVAVLDSAFAAARQGTERLITVETDLVIAVLSTKGGTLKSLQLKEYSQADRVSPIQLVDTASAGALAMLFTSPSSHAVDSRALFFSTDESSDHVVVDEDGVSVTFEATVGQGSIRQTYTFSQDSYQIDLDIDQTNPESFATREGYDLLWDGSIPFSEGNPRTEAQNAGVYGRSGGEVESIRLLREESDEKILTGKVDWVGVKSQYFAAVVIPDAITRGAEVFGEKIGEAGDEGFDEHFEAALKMRTQDEEAHHFRLYIGPLEYYRIADYGLGLYSMVDYGWKWMEWIVRPLAKFVFIPLFVFLSSFIPNYGIVIIILAIFMKVVLYPLTKSSFKNMARMRELQPQMEAVKEKHGDNPQKQQEAMMKLYKETGVNPLGGCLPMLLQYPVIIALWRFLPNSIEIRHQGFLWASDLSAPDKILQLPFEIPMYGDFVAGFTLLMGLSMIVQMRIQMASTPSNPQTKMITYLMPVMIFAIFNRFASGLSLYYLCYNIFTAVQQKWINHNLEKQREAEAVNGKESKTKASRSSKASKGGGGSKNGKARKGSVAQKLVKKLSRQ